MWRILPQFRILGEVVPANGPVVPDWRAGGRGGTGGATRAARPTGAPPDERTGSARRDRRERLDLVSGERSDPRAKRPANRAVRPGRPTNGRPTNVRTATARSERSEDLGMRTGSEATREQEGAVTMGAPPDGRAASSRAKRARAWRSDKALPASGASRESRRQEPREGVWGLTIFLLCSISPKNYLGVRSTDPEWN